MGIEELQEKYDELKSLIAESHQEDIENPKGKTANDLYRDVINQAIDGLFKDESQKTCGDGTD